MAVHAHVRAWWQYMYMHMYLESLEHEPALAVGHVGVDVWTKRFVEKVESQITTHL